jgi:hypothetical protein
VFFHLPTKACSGVPLLTLQPLAQGVILQYLIILVKESIHSLFQRTKHVQGQDCREGAAASSMTSVLAWCVVMEEQDRLGKGKHSDFEVLQYSTPISVFSTRQDVHKNNRFLIPKDCSHDVFCW